MKASQKILKNAGTECASRPEEMRNTLCVIRGISPAPKILHCGDSASELQPPSSSRSCVFFDVRYRNIAPPSAGRSDWLSHERGGSCKQQIVPALSALKIRVGRSVESDTERVDYCPLTSGSSDTERARWAIKASHNTNHPVFEQRIG